MKENQKILENLSGFLILLSFASFFVSLFHFNVVHNFVYVFVLPAGFFFLAGAVGDLANNNKSKKEVIFGFIIGGVFVVVGFWLW